MKQLYIIIQWGSEKSVLKQLTFKESTPEIISSKPQLYGIPIYYIDNVKTIILPNNEIANLDDCNLILNVKNLDLISAL